MNKYELYFDGRWIGDHGIGRFAREVSLRLKPQRLLLNTFIKPSNPLDLVYLTFVKLFSPNLLFFSPGYNSPLFGYQNYIFTIMDLNHIDVPYNSSRLKRLYYEFFLKRSCKRAKLIFTISEFSKNRICEWAKISSERVINVGCGVSDVFHQMLAPVNPGYTYFLIISNRRPHKNESRAIEAFAKAKINSSYHLVLTGDITLELEKLILNLNLVNRVHFLGRLNDNDLARWYRGTKAVLFPSLYEGFGLPVVEAMASGVPVITSNVSSMPEIAGDAAILVDPNSTQQIAEAIELLTKDETITAELIQKGLIQSKSFTWDNVAQKINTALSLNK